MLNEPILEKYNHPVPRYTSYPPATFFHEGIRSEDCLSAISESNQYQPDKLSFYVHIPFCRHHCTYCGCNAYPMVGADGIEAYMNAVMTELELVTSRLDPTRKIAQIHFGGGSPTSIPIHYLKTIVERLTTLFQKADTCEIAIECHPGYLSMQDWADLADAGFNRCSIGVQDFNDAVLKAVNRRPSKEPLTEVVAFLKSRGISVNLDFIYGLPLQTVEGFRDSMAQSILLRPDRLVTFSYAHVPWVHPVQKALEKIGLPSVELKSELYDSAVSMLKVAGYLQVGMDHFVLPGDELHRAQSTGQLHRNFQGYCTRETTGQVYAFGVTAISQLTALYVQNTKSIPNYIATLEKGILPVWKGYKLSAQEQMVREIVSALMCNGSIVWEDLAAHLGFESGNALRQKLTYSIETLAEMAFDGLIEFNDQGIRMTNDGSRFVRNVAALFDPLYKPGTTGYSLPV